MKIFGRLLVRNPRALAIAKFRACPWHFYDGVPDASADRLVWGDFAITRVMSSGLRDDLIAPVLALGASQYAMRQLRRIPLDYDAILAPYEDLSILGAVDALFSALDGHRFRVSRISKVLCRKRPRAIPMLDSLVTGFLDRIGREWSNSPVEAPDWFPEVWRGWRTGQVSPYLRMIRADARRHQSALEDVRRAVAADRDTGVPIDAPLLRIWEAIVFWHFFQIKRAVLGSEVR
ncbi:DUF6308 family protein [Sorangium sp. So ce136]|uniref:DUF6308 family protein n=1 Tax=Sorangium sp. So ce136 TaxID=3133284 RepID=UPI003F065ED4